MSTKIPFAGLAALLFLTVACRSFADTRLTAAASRGDYDAVVKLLNDGADPNETDSQGFTALMWAARFGHVEIVKTLCYAGADPNIQDGGPNHWTALIHAVHKGQNRAAILLMDNGADVNAKARGGASALEFAAGYGNTEIVKGLLDRGADPYAEDSNGNTPLSNAVGGAWDIDRMVVPVCQTETVKELLKSAPDLTLGDDFPSRVALWFARRKGCTEIVSMVENNRKSDQIPTQ